MKNLLSLRKRLNVSLRDIEDDCGIDYSTMHKLEIGKRNVTSLFLERLMNFYQCDELFVNDNDNYCLIVEDSNGSTYLLSESEIKLFNTPYIESYVNGEKHIRRIIKKEEEAKLLKYFNKRFESQKEYEEEQNFKRIITKFDEFKLVRYQILIEEERKKR